MKIQNLSFYIDLIPWLFFSDPKVFSKFPKVVTIINSGLCIFSWIHSLFAQIRVLSFETWNWNFFWIVTYAFIGVVASYEGSLILKIIVVVFHEQNANFKLLAISG